MNAYELAEKLYLSSMDTYHEEAANMLRQQADRIDRLEREAVARNNYLEQHCQKIDQQADRIAELEKQRWDEKDLKNACRNARLSEDDFLRIKAYLPVYTTPQTKPLSDEEILSLYWRAGWESDEDVVKFGRAIEAKVRGEK